MSPARSLVQRVYTGTWDKIAAKSFVILFLFFNKNAFAVFTVILKITPDYYLSATYSKRVGTPRKRVGIAKKLVWTNRGMDGWHAWRHRHVSLPRFLGVHTCSLGVCKIIGMDTKEVWTNRGMGGWRRQDKKGDRRVIVGKKKDDGLYSRCKKIAKEIILPNK